MTFKPWVYLSALLVIIILIIILQPDEKVKELPVIGQIPAFDLIDQDGEQFTLDDLKGNVWLADFIFTTCAGPCPIMTERMSTSVPSAVPDKPISKVYTLPLMDIPMGVALERVAVPPLMEKAKPAASKAPLPPLVL